MEHSFIILSVCCWYHWKSNNIVFVWLTTIFFFLLYTKKRGTAAFQTIPQTVCKDGRHLICFWCYKKMEKMSWLTAETDTWLVERLYLWDLSTLASSPNRYCADSGPRYPRWLYFLTVGGSGDMSSIFIYSLWSTHRFTAVLKMYLHGKGNAGWG